MVVLAASLGGPEAVREVLGGLPVWFSAAVLVVQHSTPAAQYLTVDLLRRRSNLEVGLAREGDRPRPHVVQVMPAERIAPALVSLVLWPGAAALLRVPLPHWATLERSREASAPQAG